MLNLRVRCNHYYMCCLFFQNTVSLNTAVVRMINSDISIRNGKFGHYIFYKTHRMTKPKFIKLAGFKGNYNTCPIDEMVSFVEKNK